MNNQLTQEMKLYLKQELRRYEEIIPMTLPERKELRAWVAAGNSVHANPGLYTYENGNEMDYLDAMRFEEELFGMHQEIGNKIGV
jgi:hypothetical protein